MKINYLGYYPQADGYGRFNSRLVLALLNRKVQVKVATMEHRDMPKWMLRHEGLTWDNLTISAMPPYFVKRIPGRQWLLTMTEGSRIPEEWVFAINNAWLERVLVPCEHNKKALEDSGVLPPVHVLNGGVDPDEFPMRPRLFEQRYGTRGRSDGQPYTFLTLADRGERKGWYETWQAFYKAFGGKTTGQQDVRLIIKFRSNKTLSFVSKGENLDPRIHFQELDAADPYEVYNQADCVVLPSRSEGWGLPHRECASMGIPTIIQNYAGLAEGAYSWGFVAEQGKMQPIPKENKVSLGEWMVADVEEIAEMMERCYNNPVQMHEYGLKCSSWLSASQTWDHSAVALGRMLRYEL